MTQIEIDAWKRAQDWYIGDSDDRTLFICEHGIRQVWDIPEEITDLHIVVTTTAPSNMRGVLVMDGWSVIPGGSIAFVYGFECGLSEAWSIYRSFGEWISSCIDGMIRSGNRYRMFMWIEYEALDE